MRNFVYILLLTVTVTVCACACAYSQEKTSKHEGYYVYLQNHDKIQSVDSKGADLFSEINIIPLKEDTDFIIGKAAKIIKCDSFLYILDKEKTKAIYKYDYEGNPVQHFLKRGGSGDEYIEILDFDIDNSSKNIMILCLPPKILYTDTDFTNLRKNNNLGYDYFDRIVGWKNKVFLYNHRDRKVAYLNPETGKSEECFRTRSMKGDLISPNAPVFFKTQNNLYFQSPGDDCIYKLQDNKFIPYLSLDFDNKKASMIYYEKTGTGDITMDDRINHPIPYIKNIIEKNDEFIFTYTYNFLVRICIYNTAKKKYTDQLKKFISESSCGFYDNAIYGIENPLDMDKFQTPAYHELMKGVKYDFTDKLDFDEKFENPVIIEQILK
jgi:hypothetical protein